MNLGSSSSYRKKWSSEDEGGDEDFGFANFGKYSSKSPMDMGDGMSMYDFGLGFCDLDQSPFLAQCDDESSGGMENLNVSVEGTKSYGPEYYQSPDYVPEFKNRSVIFSCLGNREEKVLTPSERMHLISLVQFLRLNDSDYLSARTQETSENDKKNGKSRNNDDNGNTQLRVEVEKILLVPPQHYIKSTDLRVDTESQVFEAFESALTEWRWKNGGDPSREELNDVTDATSRLYDDVGNDPVRIYAWRASPTLNWKLNGECAAKEFFQSYSDTAGDNVVYTYEEEKENDDDITFAQVPYPNLVVNHSPRLEIIMLAYRYSTIVINRVCREYNTPRFGDGGGGLGNVPGIHTKTDILISQRDNIRSSLKDLVRVYFIMQSLVGPMLAGWITLEKPVQVAELTPDCCRFYQYLVYAIRLHYCVRLQRIHYELEKERGANTSSKQQKHEQTGRVGGLGNPELFREKDTGYMLYGHHISRWAKLYMGIAITLLDAIEIYNGPISMMHGDLACPEYIKYECHEPQESIVVERLRSFMTDLCFLYLTRSLNMYVLFAETKACQIDESTALPPFDDKQKKKKKKKQDTEAEKYRNMAVTMAQIGLSCTRVMIVTNGPDVKYAKQAEAKFNAVIQEMYPKISRLCSGLMGEWGVSTEEEDCSSGSEYIEMENMNMGMLEDYRRRQELSPQRESGSSRGGVENGDEKVRKEIRICNKQGLFGYMSEVSDFFSYEHCEFLLGLFDQDTGVPKEWERYMYFYRPESRIGKTSNHLTRSGIYLKTSESEMCVKKKENRGVRGEESDYFTPGSGKSSTKISSKEIWRSMVERSKGNR